MYAASFLLFNDFCEKNSLFKNVFVEQFNMGDYKLC